MKGMTPEAQDKMLAILKERPKPPVITRVDDQNAAPTADIEQSSLALGSDPKQAEKTSSANKAPTRRGAPERAKFKKEELGPVDTFNVFLPQALADGMRVYKISTRQTQNDLFVEAMHDFLVAKGVLIKPDPSLK